MSVINSVLRDLDQKPTAFTPLELDTVAAKKNRDKGSGLYWVILPVSLILVAIVYWIEYYDIDKTEQGTQKVEVLSNEINRAKEIQPSEPQPVDSVMPVQPDTTANNPYRNQISGLQIKENEAFMELAFQLSKFSPSFLKQRSNNRYVFVIKKVANSIVTPQISDSPWLKQIRISTLNEDVEIRFDTQPGVLVDTQERRGDGSYYWLIRLKKSLEVVQVTVETDSSAAVKPEMNVSSVANAERSIKSTQQALQKEELTVAPVKLQIRPVQSKSTAKMKLDAAILAAQSGDITQARKSLEMLLGGEFDRQARTQLLGLLSQQGDSQGFNEMLQVSLQQYPQDEVYLLYEANRLFAKKQYLLLIDKFKAYTKNDQLLSLLATSYQRTDQHQLAVENFISALNINPQQPRLWISLAISQQNLSQREQALNSYQMALRSGSINQRLHDFVQSKIKQLAN
jgi:hypothetical protein